MNKQQSTKPTCASCGVPVSETDTDSELVVVKWVYLRYRKAYRCKKCLFRKRVFLLALIGLLVLACLKMLITSL